ncbi:hypothetical protein BAUCODRAFT_79709, partial [Baudoinia panamericana UAMH 10762]
YEAISYTCASPVFEDSLTCNGVPRCVTNSLSQALLYFRMQDEERFLWADAPCINQLDDGEASTQVREMLTIYRKARKVLV